MFHKSLLSSTLLFFLLFQINAQDLPDAWAISTDGRMLTANGNVDEGFYAPNEINNVELEFLQANWWQILDDNYDSGTDLLATCWINGEQFDSVGVRFKGATSFRRNDTEKKSFNITLDYMIEGQDIDGYNTFNLNCGWDDNSSMREVLYNNIGLNYYMSLKSNYVTLAINGTNWGPYQNIQQFDSDYIKEWYLSNDGTIWRGLSTSGGGGGGGGPRFGAGSSTLNYNGPDSINYNTDYILKRTEQEDPWAGLIAACDVLNNEPLTSLEEELSYVLDIDKACWFLAHEVIFADDDSYIWKGGMDYYVYFEAETGRIIPMEYDGNSVLAESHLSWDLFYNENNTDFPLMNRMLAVPSIRQRYLAHVRVILEDYFNSAYADAKIDNWKDLIDNLVQEDPKKFYTYAQFQEEIESLKQTVVTRRNFLLSDPEFTNIELLNVDEVSYSVNGVQWQVPGASDQVDVIAQVSGSVETSSVWLYYGEGVTGVFTKVEMFDDGQHNDGTAQDGQFGATIPSLTSGSYVRYYIEAIADDAAKTATYEPKGAEHDVFLYQVNLESADGSSIVINELMPANDEAIADSFGEFDDWLELYNNTSETIDLSAWTLTDDINELDKFTFKTGTNLEPGDYLIVWADDDVEQGDLHASFKLSANGESLHLLNNQQEIVDQVTFPEATTDQSYSRVPNATGDFKYQDHTIGSNNEVPLAIDESINESGIVIYPNPTTDNIIIDLVSAKSSISSVQILDLTGHTLYSNNSHINNHQINVQHFQPGIYFIRVELNGSFIMRKFIRQ